MLRLYACHQQAIQPANALLPKKLLSPLATVMQLAIGMQESRLTFRYQRTNDPYRKGPARGLWQFERGGGVRGVMSHDSTQEMAEKLCIARGVPFKADNIHTMLEFDDVLAAGFARLLLWSDPRPLPGLTAPHDEAWEYYIRNWQPGKPHRGSWDAFHQMALRFIEESS